MNYENNTQHEFRARLPWIDKIPSNVLEGRVDLGVRRTLEIVTAFASQAGNLANLADDPAAYMHVHKENTVSHIEKYLTVHTAEGFKNINMETVLEVKMGGKVLKIS